MRQLKYFVEAVEENDGAWSGWGDALDIREVYESTAPEPGQLKADEINEILDRAVETNGGSLPADLRRAELESIGRQMDGGGYWIPVIEEKYNN